MRKTLLVLMMVGTTAAFSQEESPHVGKGAVALTTNYLFRGISQTDEHPAIQGTLEYNYTPWGIYLGAWASNVDNVTSDGDLEIDWYGGIRGDLMDTGIGWDLGALYYQYPGDSLDPEKDYVEAKAGLSYGFSDIPLEPSTAATVYWSPDFFGETGDAVYVDGTVGLSLPYEFGLAFHIGYQTVDDIDGSYIDWRIGLSREVLGFLLDVSYWDAEDEDAYCGANSEHCRGTVVGTISRSF